MTVAQTDAARPAAETAAPRQYVNFMFFKVDHGFRQQDAVFKSEAKREFAEVVERYVPDRMMLFPYSTVGLKSTTDFMLWRITYDLESFQQMSADINKTRLGRYLDTISYLSMTKHSQYVSEHVHEGQEGRRLRIVPGKRPWLFVYPFVKTRDWYLLPQADRQRIMNEHIAIGHKYPRVKINTTYSFGLDDQDFVVAFEADLPAEFLDLVQELRETESSKFTVRDTPMYTCRRRSTLGEVLEEIG